MVLTPIFNVARAGVIRDLPDHKLPPEAWTDVLNMRFIDDKVVRFLGQQSAMGTPSADPSFVMAVEGAGGIFWIYAESDGASSHVYAFNSGTHEEISKSGGYNVSQYNNWNGCTFHGTPIINPVSDDPQYWSALNLSTDLQDLSNWPASTTCQIMRVYKNFLVALYTTDGSGAHPHRVLWSHRAAAGSLPSSWDHTDATVDAGIFELSDVDSGIIQDGMALRDLFAIYKNDSTWLMRFKGGQDVMEFANVLQTSGILAKRCVTPLTLPIQKTQVHFLHNGIDLGIFNGQAFESVVDKKTRKFILNDLDSVSYANSFVFDNPTQDEAWFCYPRSGSTDPDFACIWNYRENTITFRDFMGVHASQGPVESAGGATWATVTGTWSQAVASRWQEGSRRKVIVADQAGTKLLQLDTGDDFDGVAYSTLLERTGLALMGTDRYGQPKVNFEQRKLVTRVWPKIKGAPVKVTVGGAERIGDAPDYLSHGNDAFATFTPGTDEYVDVIAEGRLIAIKFEGTENEYWELDGYTMDIHPLGEH